jgi:hypothetical protein
MKPCQAERQIAASLLPLVIAFCRLISGRVFPPTISLGDGVCLPHFFYASSNPSFFLAA